MRVQELLAEETVPDYLRRLMGTLKIQELGKGKYASVFQHPMYHNVAVKIFEYDPEYLAYIRLCQKTKNRWLPHVVSVHKLKMDEVETWRHKKYNEKPGKTDAYIVFFEKLRAASMKEIWAAVKEIAKDVPEEHSMELLDNTFEDWHRGHWQIVKQFAKDKDTKKLAEIAVRFGFHDVHDQNVMIRSNGQLVFTDPVAS